MNQFLHRVLKWMTSLFWGLTAFCASAQKADTTYVLESSVVSDHKTDKETIPVHILSGEELELLNAHSVADAVRFFSGVQVKDYGGVGGLKTVNVRSMGSHHVGVFYDGVEVTDAQNGVVDLGRFSLDNMEAVSLYNGQKSAIFQPAKDYASASAIYMRTRIPQFKGNKKYHIHAGLKVGSFKTVNPSLVWEQKINEHLSSSVSAEYLYTSGEYPFSYAKKGGYDTTEVRKNGDVTMLRAEAALFGKIRGGSWNTKLYYYKSERGYPGASVREEPGKFRHEDRQWDDDFFAQGSFKKNFSARYSLMLNAKYAYDYLHYLSDPRLDVATMYIDNQYYQQEVYASVAHLFSILPQWTFSLANDLQWNVLDSDMKEFAYPRRLQFLTAAATSLNLGFMKFQASLLHTFVKDRTLPTGKAAQKRNAFTPSAILSIRPFSIHDFHIRAFYKRVFRLPTLNDLYYTFIGNIDLEPEFTNQYNLGISYAHRFKNQWMKSVEFQLDGYFNQVQNKIIAMPTSNQFRWTMINLGYVEIGGSDLSLQAEMQWGDFHISPGINYSYQRARDLTDQESPWYGGQIPYIPWHSGSIIVNARYRNWSLNYSFIYTGERYEAVANIPENYAQPWYTHDMSLTRLFDFKGFDMKLTGEVNNLFNQQYEVVQCYPMPGINFNLKVNFIL